MSVAGGAVLLVLVALFYWRDDILRTGLDPKTPFQTYRPPPTPDYGSPVAWALLPSHVASSDGGVDVFFVHPTTYDGGRDWNASVSDTGPAAAELARVILPNYAGPFARVGRVFAPRYRQASLYATQLTLRDDAREARVFAYRDVRAAFNAYLSRWSGGRPFILVGVEQGGQLAARLSREVRADPALSRRFVAAYLIEVVGLAGRDPPPCAGRSAFGCRVGYVSAAEGDFTAKTRLLDRAQVWNSDDTGLEDLHGRPDGCVNPLTGSADAPAAPAKANLGSANATGLEWGVRPALLMHQAAARCEGGILRVSAQRSPDLKRSGSWTDRLKVRPFNLFWGNLEADALTRRDAYLAAQSAQGSPRP